MKQIVYILIILLSLNSCKHKDNREHIIQLVQEWQGKEIVFPESMAFTRFVTDTANYSAFTLDTVDNPTLRAEYKVLLYVDSTGCSECKLKQKNMVEWRRVYSNMIWGLLLTACLTPYAHTK